MNKLLIFLVLILIKNCLLRPQRSQRPLSRRRDPTPASSSSSPTLTISQTRDLVDAYQRGDVIGLQITLIDIRLSQLSYDKDEKEIIELLRLRRDLRRIHPYYLRATGKRPPPERNSIQDDVTKMLDDLTNSGLNYALDSVMGNGRKAENPSDSIQEAAQFAGNIANSLLNENQNVEETVNGVVANGDVVGEMIKQGGDIFNAFAKMVNEPQPNNDAILAGNNADITAPQIITTTTSSTQKVTTTTTTRQNTTKKQKLTTTTTRTEATGQTTVTAQKTAKTMKTTTKPQSSTTPAPECSSKVVYVREVYIVRNQNNVPPNYNNYQQQMQRTADERRLINYRD